MEGTSLRVGAVDDTPIVLEGLEGSLARHLPGVRFGPAERSVAAFLAAGPEVDVVLLDIELGDGTDAGENVRALKGRGWAILIYTQDTRSRLVKRAFRAGADGIVSKGAETLEVAQAVQAVAAGDGYLSADWAAVVADDEAWATPNLTTREVEAVRLYAAGLKLSTVARRLNVTDDTARTYLLRARGKYANVGRPAATKTELFVRAVEDGILPPPDAPEAPPQGS